MRHRSTAPSFYARATGALSHGLEHTRSAARHAVRPSGRHSARRPGGRLALGAALATTVTGLLLTVPVVSLGSSTPDVVVNSSSSGAARHIAEASPEEVGGDGRPAPAGADAEPGSANPPAELPPTSVAVSPGTATEVPAGSAPPASAPLAGAAAAGTVTPDVEAEVLALVNTARAGSGCEPLVHDEGLATVARSHSSDMRDRSFFDHVNPSGLDPFERAEAAGQTNARAENLAVGKPGPAEVMDSWLASSIHRANILDCSLRTLGVGVAEGPAGPWWTQLFGG